MTTIIFLCMGAGLLRLASRYLRRESAWVRRMVIIFSFAAFANYMVWRLMNLPPPAWSLLAVGSYTFLVFESMAAYLWVLDTLCLKRVTNRTPEVEGRLDWYGDNAPRVDVLIATYNEPWEVLEKTLTGVTQICYPNYKAWVLDDGNRPWLREKAEAYGLGYVTRTDNKHYKAGNLNNGVRQIRARGVALEFLALLDADFIARPDFLRRTMALMRETNVGIVQTPQVFYNPDPHQRAFGGVKAWPDEQRAWFDVYLPALDAQGWATCCGTSCLIRVVALDAIEGFPTESVSEDTLSSMKMSGKGYKTLVLSERLTIGLAPEGIGEFLAQRARWLIGGVQNTRVFGAQPGIGARIRYWLTLWRSAIWGIMPMGWMIVSILWWFTGVSLIPAQSFEDATAHFGPMVVDRFLRGWMFGGRQMYLITDAVWLLLAPFWVKQTVLGVFGVERKFKVTDKAVHRDKMLVHWRFLPTYLFFAGLLLAGLIYNMIDSAAPLYRLGLFQMNTLMTAYFLVVLFAGAAPLIEAPRRRVADRYPTTERVTALIDGQEHAWRCHDISLGGVLVEPTGADPLPHDVELRFDDVGPVRASLVRRVSGKRAAFAFQSPEARPGLIRKLFFTDRYIETPTEWSFGPALFAVFKRLLF